MKHNDSNHRLHRRNTIILALCQALYMSGTSLIVSTTALVGSGMAPDKTYAGLPFAAQLIATMLTSIPAAMLMARIGRKAAFLVSVFIAMTGGTLCSIAIIQHRFVTFISGCILLGIFSGFANYYRFTAADNVAKEYKSRAISYVLTGGVIAAVIGPNLANYTRDTISNANFAGSYASTMVLYVLSFILLLFLKLPHHDRNTLHGSMTSSGRPVFIIARQPRYIVAVICGMLGYCVMYLVMTATPLAMQHHAHPFSDTSFVIQWHVLGMFVPSFFTGHLIIRFGVSRIMLLGAVFSLICIAVNLSGTTVTHFWLALLLLGIGWNFLFIGATTLLTDTYHPEERFKAQALNDFLVYSMVAASALSSGILQHQLGWQAVNIIALLPVSIICVSLGWLYRVNRGGSVNIESETLREAAYRAE